jgi:hypothetical protein
MTGAGISFDVAMNRTLCLVAVALAAYSVPADYVTKKITAKKAGLYEANAVYLEFSKSHPLAGVINPFLKNLAAKEHSEWIKLTLETQKDLGKPTSAWEHEIGMDVMRSTPRLVSIAVSTYDYSGGAHPNHGVDMFNFGLVRGKARQLKLADFFATGFNSSAFISKLVIARLKKEEGATSVQDGEVKTLNAKQLQRFSVGADGLTWYFNPYEVGPYAAGDFEVKLSLKELGPKFNKAMLLGR